MALIATLAILSILTILLLTYVSIVSSDRVSTQNYSQGLMADQIARSGLAQVLSQLRAEVTDTNDAAKVKYLAGGVPGAPYPIYRPLKNTAAVPERMGNLPGDPALATLVKVSKPGSPFYTTRGTGGANYALKVEFIGP